VPFSSLSGRKAARFGLSLIALTAAVPALADAAAEVAADVVVTAAGFEQKIVDAPASISVISAEELSKRPYITLIDAVRDLEGVDVGETSDKTGQRTISIRGMGADYTLVLIDGKRQNNHGNIYPNDFGGNQFNHIPPLDAIERIEVIRGPASTLYGADALGGVINIITKKALDRWTGSATFGRSLQEDRNFGDDMTLDVAASGPLLPGLLGLSVRGSLYERMASKPDYAPSVGPDGVEYVRALGFGAGGRTVNNSNKSVGFSVNLTPASNHSFTFDFDYSKQSYDNSPMVNPATGAVSYPLGTLDGINSLWRASNTGQVQPQVGYTKEQLFDRMNWAVTHQGDWGVARSFISLAYVATNNKGRTMPFSVAERLQLQDIWNAACVSIGAAPSCRGSNQGSYKAPTLANLTAGQRASVEAFLPRPIRKLESNQYTLDARVDIPLEDLAGTHNLVVGGQYIDGALDDSVFGLEASTGGIAAVQDHRLWSLFAEDNWTPIEGLTITGGLRYDDHNMFGSHLSPRLYAKYTITQNLTVKGGVSSGYKTPQTTDLYDGVRGFGGQGTSPQIGNPELKPETSVNSELAIYWDLSPSTGFNVTLFHNKFKNRIQTTTVQPCAVTGFVRPCANLGDYFQILGLGAAGVSVPVNVDDSRIQGVEVAARYQILPGVSLRANYTFTDSEQLSGAKKGLPLTNNARHMANASLNWDVLDGLSAQLSAEHRSQRYRGLSAVDGRQLYWKSYEVVNLGAQYRLNDFVTLSGRVNNLLNRDFTSYAVDFAEATPGAGYTPTYVDDYNNKDKARSYWISVNARF
jgi:outer membrane receptor for ferrienterochelin and colicins